MATQLQIKRSTADVVPTITYGELAYSTRTTATGDTGGGYIWVADSANAARVIGGDHFVKMLDHDAGTNTANNALVVDASKKINELLTENVTVSASNLTFGAVADVIVPRDVDNALQITDGTDTYLTVKSDTGGIGRTVTLNGKHGGDFEFAPATSNITFATSMNVKDQAGTPNTYLSFGEVSGTKTVTIGQALDIGANDITTTGDISAGSGTFSENNATVTIKNATDEFGQGQADTFIKMTDHKDNELGKIVASHDGSADDAKGQLKIYTGATASDATGSAATEAVSIGSDQKTTFKGDVDIGVDGTTKDLTVWGNLVVEGTTTTIDTATLTVDDHNIELGSVTTPTDATATGGGITLRGASNKTIVWDNTNRNWTFDTGTGTGGVNLDGTRATDYKINNVSVLNATVLGSTVVTSSLTTVGALDSGSITSNFGNINNGGSSVSTGILNASGLASLDGGIDVDGAFTVANTSGNIATSGTLGVSGTSTLGVINASGLASLDGGIDVDGKFTVADSTGNVATSGTLDVTGLAAFGADITLFDASNNGDPSFSMGKDATDTLKITAVYDSVGGNEQKLNSVKIDTASTLGGTDDGEIQLFVDGDKKFTILDGGAEGHYVESGAGETSYTMPTDSNFTSKKPYLDNFTVDGGTWS